MSENKKLTPLAKAIGVSVVAGLASMSAANAAANPFAMTDLGTGYKVAAQGNCGEGKCGGKKAGTEEGKCGGKKEAVEEGKCGGKKSDKKEGACGEGKCGGKK